jgi:hypothetical protein
MSYEKAREVKRRVEAQLMSIANVVGVGVGLRQIGDEYSDEVAIIVMVRKKLDEAELKPEDIVPEEIDGIFVDVQEVGELQAGV